VALYTLLCDKKMKICAESLQCFGDYVIIVVGFAYNVLT
jgi:hydrogenase maturation factor